MARKKKSPRRPMIQWILNPELRQLVVSHALATGRSMSEITSSIVADHFGHPELAQTARKLMGRRPVA